MDNSVMVGAGEEAMPYLKCLLPCLPALILPMKLKILSLLTPVILRHQGDLDPKTVTSGSVCSLISLMLNFL